MATTKTTEKKPAVKPTASKSTTAKSAAAKKPAAKAATKKPAVKPAAKTAAKKPAAKTAAKPTTAKPAAKKPVAKKPAVKPTTAKKPAVKTTAKQTAAKKPAAKPTAAKPTADKPKAATAKASATKPAAKKPAVKKSVEVSDGVKVRNLFDAYAQNKLPFAHGYIVSSFLDEKSAYSIYEIVSYAGVKEIFLTGNGLTFVTGGKKLYVLVEPDTYNKKFLEPVSRAEGERIPKRTSELDIIIARNQSKIMIAKHPDESFGSFTILRPQGLNFSVIFYDLPDMYKTISDFFVNSLNRQRKIPETDAKKAAAQITKTIEKYMSFKGEFE